MLLYPNHSLCRIVAQTSGSIFFRRDIVIVGIILALITAGLQIIIDTEQGFAPDLPHHYGMHALGTVVGFAVVFRTTFSWQRYWEAISQLHLMYSKWEDSYGQLLAFASISIEKNTAQGTDEAAARTTRLTRTCDGALNMFSLMSAYAADRLLHGDNQRMRRRLKVGRWKDQIITRRGLRCGEDITGAKKMPHLSVSRPTSVRMSQDWTSQDCNDWDRESYNVCVEPPETLRKVLESSSDRTTVVMYWLTHDLAGAATDLDTPPPIQSRMYQELSNGMLGFNQAMKIADVPFPFPFAQMLTLLMVCFTIFVPVYVACFTQSVIVGPIMSFLLFEGMWGMNELAKELETPFGEDINHIPLEDFHQRFVEACSDMHRAHIAKMKVCAEPDAGGIRSGNSRRPSLAEMVKKEEGDTSPSSEVESMSMNGFYLPSSILHQGNGALHAPVGTGCLKLQPLERLPARQPSPDVESPTKPSRTASLAKGSSSKKSERERASSTGSLGSGLSRPSQHGLKDMELWREVGVRETVKVLDEQLVALSLRMEQHLHRIASDTRSIAEAARTLCPKLEPEAPLPLGSPPLLDPKGPVRVDGSVRVDGNISTSESLR